MAKHKITADEYNALIRNDDVCYTGGAQGADYQFALHASNAQHDVFVMSFDGHSRSIPMTYQRPVVVEHSQEQLNAADNLLYTIQKFLNRPSFNGYKTYQKNLLRRNYYQVDEAEAVYAVTSICWDDAANGCLNVEGGTGWTCNLFARMQFKRQTVLSNALELNMYVFDQNKKAWYKPTLNKTFKSDLFSVSWKKCEHVPKPKGYYAGIGTRDLNEHGKQAIVDLYHSPSNPIELQ